MICQWSSVPANGKKRPLGAKGVRGKRGQNYFPSQGENGDVLLFKERTPENISGATQPTTVRRSSPINTFGYLPASTSHAGNVAATGKTPSWNTPFARVLLAARREKGRLNLAEC